MIDWMVEVEDVVDDMKAVGCSRSCIQRGWSEEGEVRGSEHELMGEISFHVTRYKSRYTGYTG